VDESHPIAALNPGDSLDLIGPLGAGFRLPGGSAHLLIVAEQPARMLMVLRTALDQHWSAAWLWATAVPGWAATLLPSEVEFHTGPLAPELCEWADVIVLDVAGAKEIAARVREMRPLRPTDFVRAVCAPLMPCGVGACQACWVPTRHGKRLACVDGPIFAI
jgi:dihydroorotate dehydrogenase electron transfer subunit